MNVRELLCRMESLTQALDYIETSTPQYKSLLLEQLIIKYEEELRQIKEKLKELGA